MFLNLHSGTNRMRVVAVRGDWCKSESERFGDLGENCLCHTEAQRQEEYKYKG